MTVHLGHDDRAKVGSLFESLSLTFSSLANGTIHDKNGRIRFLQEGERDWFAFLSYKHFRHETYYSSRDLLHFFKELSFLLVATGGVDNDDLEFILLELFDTLQSDFNGIGFGVTEMYLVSYSVFRAC